MKEIAIAAAREAGQLMLDWRKGFPPCPASITYKGFKDVVTEVDGRAEEIIIGHIGRNFPEHNVLAEEGGIRDAGKNSPYLWIIDPLDGTANYAADLATSCVSIGVAYQEETILGVIYNPFRNELFVAEKGKGATLNGQAIHPSNVASLDKALMSFDLGYNEERAVEQLRECTFLRPHVRSMRILGSAVLALAYVAVGRFDLFYHQGLSAWDLAAGLLVLQEAGAIASDADGAAAHYSKPNVVAANPNLHAPFLALRAEYKKSRSATSG